MIKTVPIITRWVSDNLNVLTAAVLLLSIVVANPAAAQTKTSTEATSVSANSRIYTLPTEQLGNAVAQNRFPPNRRAPGFGLPVIGEVRGPALPDADLGDIYKVKPEIEPRPAIQATRPNEKTAQKAPPRTAARTSNSTVVDATESIFDKITSVFSADNEPLPEISLVGGKENINTQPPQSGHAPENSNGWAVRKIEKTAVTSYPLQPKKQRARKSVSPLPGTPLFFTDNLVLGLAPPPSNSDLFKASCIGKKSGAVAFCLVDLHWPTDIAGLFSTSTIFYNGTKTIVRYDEERARYYQTLFPTKSFAAVVKHFTRRYGPPTRIIERSIAPLASPRIANPTVIWDSLAPSTHLTTTLEIRTFDDSRGSFPDTRRGVALLYDKWSRPIFPYVSTVELMIIRAHEPLVNGQN